MSVYIKGLEMPKDGTYSIVHIYSDGHVSMPFWGKGMQIVKGIEAIAVPDHGRLIDADAYDFPGDLKYEPTIIEADKEGEA